MNGITIMCLHWLKSKEACSEVTQNHHVSSLAVIVSSASHARMQRQFKGMKSVSDLSSGRVHFLVIAVSHFDKQPKGGSRNEFPGIPETGGFCGNSTEPQQNHSFPGISRPIPISDFGVPIFSVWGGKLKLICWATLAASH